MRVLEGLENKSVPLDVNVPDLRERFLSVRRYTEEICKPLQRDDFIVQPAADVSPPKWHLAHTTWFFEQFLLNEFYPGYQPFNPKYFELFHEFSHDGESAVPINRGNLSRPTVDEIFAYRQFVDDRMLDIVDELSEKGLTILLKAMNHEQQHQELLFTDIKYILGHNPLFPPYKVGFSETHNVKATEELAAIPEGEYSIGYNGYGFCFENEQRVHHVVLRAFQIRKSLVSNIEFLEFIESGGYQRPEYWLNDAWQWVKANDIRAPLYWHKIDGRWHRYALSGLELVEEAEPVTHISFYEAAAFANWKGMRLPTEFEWEAAADQFRWGERWEHTNSAYLPYPGYVRPEEAPGEYGGKFMINAMVLRGASVVTPPDHSRKTYRHFLYPQIRSQFSGIRLCKD